MRPADRDRLAALVPRTRRGILRQLLVRYDPEVMEAAIEDVAVKVGSGYVQSYGDKWLRYLHAVARNMASDAGGGE